jgi:hypothetical protein
LKAPEAPLALAIALLPTAVLIGIAYWRFRMLRSHTHLIVIAFSVGAALAALIATVSATYVWHSLAAAQASNE